MALRTSPLNNGKQTAVIMYTGIPRLTHHTTHDEKKDGKNPATKDENHRER